MEDGWKVKMNICTALWSFVNFCCLSQSEVSTDNRKVSIFFASSKIDTLLRNGLDKNDSNNGNEHVGVQKGADFSIVCTYFWLA